MKSEVAFLTAASSDIGLGHLRRCRNLAHEMEARGAKVRFALFADSGGRSLLADSGFEVEQIKRAAYEPSRRELLIVDDYAVTEARLRDLRRRAGRLAVIDDLADRMLDADLIQNGNANAASLPYRTTAGCVRLLGPRYSLVGPAFRNLPRRQARAAVERILVTFGGADPSNLTSTAIATVRRMLPNARLDVVIGPMFRARGRLEAEDAVQIHDSPSSLSALMVDCDLAVTAAGQTTYELASAGVPALAFCAAANQRQSLTALSEIGTLVPVKDLGDSLTSVLRSLAADRARRQRMIHAGQCLVDGYGTERVAAALLSLHAEVNACA